ncbi:hypothetical protein RRG08_043947 [Elysia crispata]|uniref:Uncharacterized protein n=1 Tax=Elysia crispata TaxID=231223 RepID=A0AAE0Y0C4_9GAST|nr:hypothetical protein RRG08_043947 [Elysia crispata]
MFQEPNVFTKSASAGQVCKTSSELAVSRAPRYFPGDEPELSVFSHTPSRAGARHARHLRESRESSKRWMRSARDHVFGQR